MTTVSQLESATIEAEPSQLQRTFAMNVVSAGYGAMTAGLVYLVLLFMGAGDEFRASALVPVFTAITAIVACFGLVSVVWSGARRRAWAWLVIAIPALFILVMNATYLAYDIARPTITETFLRSMLVLAGGLAIILGGVTAFFEVRRGRPIWTRSGRAGALSMTGVGIALGAAATALLVGLVPTGGPGGTKTPTVTGVITIEDLAFIGSPQMKNDEVLGLIITNPEDVPHSFDIDSLDIHVQVSPETTTAVVVQPTGPGNLEFYCSVHTHRDRGMVGAISVE
jgi:Cupredoxin-like domain